MVETGKHEVLTAVDSSVVKSVLSRHESTPWKIQHAQCTLPSDSEPEETHGSR